MFIRLFWTTQKELEETIGEYISINKYSNNDYMLGICRGYEIAIAKMQLILNEEECDEVH
jgi:hypothetical protein